MANKDDSFLSKHGDKINAAGHAINTLQNAKIAERQRKIAQLQAATAALQQEENELKKKELELLEKQQKALEKEQRKARKEKKQKEELKSELLEIAPQLKRMLENIGESGKKGSIATGLKLYEASAAISYLEQNKKVMDDINFHEYLFSLKDLFTQSSREYEEEFEEALQVLEKLNNTVTEKGNYISVITKILSEPEVNSTLVSEFDDIKANIYEIRDNDVLRKRLTKEVLGYKDLLQDSDPLFGDKFIVFAVTPNELKNTYNFLTSLKSKSGEELELIKDLEKKIDAFEEFERQTTVAKKLVEYLESKNSIKDDKATFKNTSCVKIKKYLQQIDRQGLPSEIYSELNYNLGLYLRVVRKRIEDVNNLELSEYSTWVNDLYQLTGLEYRIRAEDFDNIKLKKFKSPVEGIGTAFAIIVFFIVLLILMDTLIKGNVEASLPIVVLLIFVLILFLVVGFLSSLDSKKKKSEMVFNKQFVKTYGTSRMQPTPKRVEEYISEIEGTLKHIENWGK